MKESTKILLIIAGIIIVIGGLIGLGWQIKVWHDRANTDSDTTHRAGIQLTPIGRVGIDSAAAILDMTRKFRATDSAKRATEVFYRRLADSLVAQLDRSPAPGNGIGPEPEVIPAATLDTLIARMVRVGDSTYTVHDKVHAIYVLPPGNYFADVWVDVADTPVPIDTTIIRNTVHEGASIFDVGKWILIGAAGGIIAIEVVNHLPGD